MYITCSHAGLWWSSERYQHSSKHSRWWKLMSSTKNALNVKRTFKALVVGGDWMISSCAHLAIDGTSCYACLISFLLPETGWRAFEGSYQGGDDYPSQPETSKVDYLHCWNLFGHETLLRYRHSQALHNLWWNFLKYFQSFAFSFVNI